MYESRRQAPLSLRRFTRRLALHALFAASLLAGSLAFGVIGYHMFEDLPWLDALLNAAMLLGGMGPVDAPLTPAGKVFASVYALYCGLVFIAMAALLFTPVMHRMLHHFHWGEKKQ